MPAFDFPPAQTEQELLERYAALACDKQTDLYELIGDTSWNANLDAGTIAFGSALVLQVQVLGSFSHASHTWRWAWVNEPTDLPEFLLRYARQLHAYGEQSGLDLLTVGEFDATVNDLHLLGATAVGLCEASGYYLADHGPGILLLAVTSELLNQAPKNDFARIPRVFSQVISSFELRHRPAFRYYLIQKGYAPMETPEAISAAVDAGTLTATFDDLGRLTSLKGTGGG